MRRGRGPQRWHPERPRPRGWERFRRAALAPRPYLVQVREADGTAGPAGETKQAPVEVGDVIAVSHRDAGVPPGMYVIVAWEGSEPPHAGLLVVERYEAPPQA